MATINKGDLISQYKKYKAESYNVGFNHVFEFDRVEKILEGHGWLEEAEEAFEELKESIKERRENLEKKLIEVLEIISKDSITEFEDEIKLIKEEVKEVDRFGLVRIRASEQFLNNNNVDSFTKAQVLMILGDIGL